MSLMKMSPDENVTDKNVIDESVIDENAIDQNVTDKCIDIYPYSLYIVKRSFSCHKSLKIVR